MNGYDGWKLAEPPEAPAKTCFGCLDELPTYAACECDWCGSPVHSHCLASCAACGAPGCRTCMTAYGGDYYCSESCRKGA